MKKVSFRPVKMYLQIYNEWANDNCKILEIRASGILKPLLINDSWPHFEPHLAKYGQILHQIRPNFEPKFGLKIVGITEDFGCRPRPQLNNAAASKLVSHQCQSVEAGKNRVFCYKKWTVLWIVYKMGLIFE